MNKIRETGTTLLKAADILLLPATGKEVQLKKREVANHLEQLFPKVFGATPGSNRDFELQRTTSYAILTTAMDKAKRKPIDKTKTHGKRRAELAPSPPRAKRVMYTTAVKPVQDPSLSMPKPEIRTATEPSAASAAGNDLVVIFTTISDGIAVYSPMSWAEMIPSGDELPSLKQVHVNLMEDGLDIKWNQYTLYDPEGIPVRSDKCLNYLLGCCLKKGVVEVEWMVVVDSRLPLFRYCWGECSLWTLVRQWGSQEDA